MDNINKKSMKEIEKVLLKDPRFVSEDGYLLKNKVYESGMHLDTDLLNLLLTYENFKFKLATCS